MCTRIHHTSFKSYIGALYIYIHGGHKYMENVEKKKNEISKRTQVCDLNKYV